MRDLSRTVSRTAIVLWIALLGGCGRDHAPARRDPTAVSDKQLQKLQEEAADAVVTAARKYLEGREKGARLVGDRPAMEASEAAFVTLVEAQAALDVAGRAERVAADEDAREGDRGRAARVRTSAGLLRRAAETASKSALETIRSGKKSPDLETDALFLRALLRALRVDVLAMQRAVAEPADE